MTRRNSAAAAARRRRVQSARSAGGGQPAPGARRAIPRQRGSHDAPIDALAEYRRMLGPRTRTVLLVGIAGLCVVSVDRALTAAGLVAVAALIWVFGVAQVSYFRVLYRVRRHDPQGWQPGPSFLLGVLRAPLGLGLPNPTRYDRCLVAASGVAAMLLAVLVLAGPR